MSRLFLLVIIAALAAMPGCSLLERARGKNFADDDAKWGESLREPGPEGELFGFSERAKQIERNVGVR